MHKEVINYQQLIYPQKRDKIAFFTIQCAVVLLIKNAPFVEAVNFFIDQLTDQSIE